MKIPILDDRLYLAASFVRDGGVALDIGTDHAYIPIFLVNSGRCEKALASDINEGPISSAKEHAKKYSAENEIEFYVADGADGIPLKEKGVTDVIICGMGGELIADIIEKCDYFKAPDIRLILQPMTKVERLREYLSQKGFDEVGGGLAKVGKHIYQCIVCAYSGVSYNLSLAQMICGKCSEIRESPLFSDFLEKHIQIQTKRLCGKEKEEAEKVIKELTEIKNSLYMGE